MNDLLSTISGKLGGPTILGTFAPTAVFVVLLRLLVAPMLPDWTGTPLAAALVSLGSQWQWVLMLAVAVILTVILDNLNSPLVRLYEGYPWQNTWFGRHRTAHYERLMALRQAQAHGLGVVTDKLAERKETIEAEAAAFDAARSARNPIKTDGGVPLDRAAARLDERIAGLERKRTQVFTELNRDFPHQQQYVLPTMLGNALRAFEAYPKERYGMDSVFLWPRLRAVTEPAYSGETDSAEAVFNFMLNATALSALLALALLVAGLASPVALPDHGALLLWALDIAICGVASIVFYHLAVGRAEAWGHQVRGAFDLYRWDLLEKLGFERKFRDTTEEKQFWDKVSRRIMFGDSRDPAQFPPYRLPEEAAAPKAKPSKE